jgi:hypothetical protein
MPTNEFHACTALFYDLLPALDRGVVLDIGETHAHVEDGTLFDWLETELGPAFRWMLSEPTGQQVVLPRFQALSSTTADGKFGVQRNGLALLVGYCFDIAAQHASN